MLFTWRGEFGDSGDTGGSGNHGDLDESGVYGESGWCCLPGDSGGSGNYGDSSESGDSLILVILMNLAQLVIWVNLFEKFHSEYGGSGGPG